MPICKSCGKGFEIPPGPRRGRPRVVCYADTCDRAKLRLKHPPKYDKVCTSCGKEFKARGTRAKYCEPCMTEQWRIRRLFQEYGITPEEYDALVLVQGNRCRICGGDSPGDRITRWCVDHDHRTGKVRGLLCTNCNQGIGKFKDDPVKLRLAAQYLERTS